MFKFSASQASLLVLPYDSGVSCCLTAYVSDSPANGKPMQWRGGKPNELVLSQLAEFLGNPPNLPSLRLVRKFSIIAKS